MTPSDYRLVRGNYKNLTIRIVPQTGEVRVTSPWFLPKMAVDHFVEQRRSWIESKRREVLVQQEVARAQSDSLPTSIRLWGQSVAVILTSPGRLPRVLSDTESRSIILRVPASWSDAQNRKILSRWLIQQTRAAVEELLQTWCARTGLKVESWTVKPMRSRWGSCRPDSKRLAFNSHLAQYPRECLEHVVVHELAHLIEPRHNARFHQIVESWLPGAERARKLLKLGPDGAE